MLVWRVLVQPIPRMGMLVSSWPNNFRLSDKLLQDKIVFYLTVLHKSGRNFDWLQKNVQIVDTQKSFKN